MSDIEDQLLELAGGDESSDNEEEPMDMSRDDSRSPSPAPSQDQKDTPAKKTPAKKANKRVRSDDGSDEEGEASSVPGSPSSQQSVPMDESDSDDESTQGKARGDDDANQYPIDGLFRDYDEKEQIMGMREIEREQILAERREENERIRQNRMLRQLKVNQDKDNKKRKASAAELEDAQRKTARVRTKAGETSEKMDSLRRAREERSNRKEQRERENDRRKQRSPSYRRSPGGDDGDSDIDWAGPSQSKHKSRTPEIKESPPAELREVERARVGRSNFAMVCYTPGFEDALTGCFVRINIGPDPQTRQDVYRMAVIKGFSQGRAYAMPDSSGQQMVVETYVKAAHGKAQREWPFIMCSDRGFTEAEWNRYKTVCSSEGVPIPTRDMMKNKVNDINRVINHSWTEQELSDKFKRLNALRIKYSGVERDNLVKKLEAARARGEEETAKDLQEKLDNLEVPRLAFKTSINPPKKTESKGPTQQERLARLNLEARRKNAEEVRKAQLAERAKTREIEKRIERGEIVTDDHSRRVRTRMKFVHDANEYDDLEKAKAAGTGANTAAGSGTSTPAAGGTPKVSKLLPHILKLQEQQRTQEKNGVPGISQPLMDDDIIGAMDLDIDIDL